jgi:hypothetical protein
MSVLREALTTRPRGRGCDHPKPRPEAAAIVSTPSTISTVAPSIPVCPRVLLRLMDRVGEPFPGGTLIPVKLRRRELATMAATTLESVSRALNRWQKEGIVVLQPQGFVVKDKRALARLAG